MGDGTKRMRSFSNAIPLVIGKTALAGGSRMVADGNVIL